MSKFDRNRVKDGWEKLCTNKQTDRQTDRHYGNNGHLAVNQLQRIFDLCVIKMCLTTQFMWIAPNLAHTCNFSRRRSSLLVSVLSSYLLTTGNTFITSHWSVHENKTETNDKNVTQHCIENSVSMASYTYIQAHWRAINTWPAAETHISHYRSYWGRVFTGQMTQRSKW